MLCICVWYASCWKTMCRSFVKCERRWGDDRSCREVELNSIIYRHTPPRHSDKYISGFGEILWTLLMRSYQINNQLHLTTYIPSLAESYFLREGFMKLGILMQGMVYFCMTRSLYLLINSGPKWDQPISDVGDVIHYTKVHVFSVCESKSLCRQMW